MNFKDEYSKMQNEIKPSAVFLEELARKMEAGEQPRQRKRSAKRVVFPVSTAAAVAAAAAALVVMLNVKTPAPIPIKTAVNIKFSYTVGEFAESGVFSDDISVPVQLAQILADSETRVYKSDRNSFDESGRLNDEQSRALSERIGAAFETSAELEKKTEHYMAVTADGDIVKFRVSGDVLEVDGKTYSFSRQTA